MTDLVVVDTNIWISAALSTTGAPSQVVNRVLAQGRPVFSDATFEELEQRLWKPKFDRYLTLETRRAILRDAKALALWVKPAAPIAAMAYCRDADDDKFIHAALAANASWLVTGDQDLLVLAAGFESNGSILRIVSAAAAIESDRFCNA